MGKEEEIQIDSDREIVERFRPIILRRMKTANYITLNVLKNLF